jgi:hypothetical protein
VKCKVMGRKLIRRMLYAELNVEDVESAEPKTHEWTVEQMAEMEEMKANPNVMPEMIASFIQEHGLKKPSAFTRLSYWDRILNHLFDVMHQQKNNGGRVMDELEGEHDTDEFKGVMADLGLNVNALFWNNQVKYIGMLVYTCLYLVIPVYTNVCSFHTLCILHLYMFIRTGSLDFTEGHLRYRWPFSARPSYRFRPKSLGADALGLSNEPRIQT